MNSKKPIIVKRLTQSAVESQRHSRLIQELVVEPGQPEVEQPEQAPVVYLQLLAERFREESVYGSGWRLN